ncbi:MAG: CDP-alcohol phosphatidyltransferase family protein [Bacteroidota bacterium]
MQIKKHIPNLITLLNLFCGCIAITFLKDLQTEDNFEIAFYFVCLGIFFDFFDGFFARLWNVAGPLGVQLDSLADMVTSGLVPGFAMFWMFKLAQPPMSNFDILPYFGFIITLGSCYRLANFNIDTRQTNSFIGLPTPANALFILSLPLVVEYSNSLVAFEILTNQWVLIGITCFSAYVMNAEIPLFSLKIKELNEYTYKKNSIQIYFLILSVVMLFFLHYLAIPLIIVAYVFISAINESYLKK